MLKYFKEIIREKLIKFIPSFFIKKKEQENHIENKLIFITEEIIKLDNIFSNYKLYSASIQYSINNVEITDIEKIKNNINSKYFECDIINKNGKLKIIIFKKKEK